MKRVFIKTYGCQMNERDSELVAHDLVKNGYELVGDENAADIVLLNTCSVREHAEQKAIGKANHVIGKRKKTQKVTCNVLKLATICASHFAFLLLPTGSPLMKLGQF